MKKIFALFAVLAVFTCAFADENLTFSNVNFSAEKDIIVHTDNFFDKYAYQTVDGTKLSNKELLSRISLVDENEKLLKEEKAWRVTSYVLYGLSIAAVGVNVSTLFVDNADYNRIAGNASVWTFAVSCSGAIFSSLFANSKLNKAVDNFNIRVMGIPIN